jgi:hypothetical protein
MPYVSTRKLIGGLRLYLYFENKKEEKNGHACTCSNFGSFCSHFSAVFIQEKSSAPKCKLTSLCPLVARFRQARRFILPLPSPLDAMCSTDVERWACHLGRPGHDLALHCTTFFFERGAPRRGGKHHIKSQWMSTVLQRTPKERK